MKYFICRFVQIPVAALVLSACGAFPEEPQWLQTYEETQGSMTEDAAEPDAAEPDAAEPDTTESEDVSGSDAELLDDVVQDVDMDVEALEDVGDESSDATTPQGDASTEDAGADIDEDAAEDVEDAQESSFCEVTICDDNDPCTIDTCNVQAASCQHEPVDCDDADLCTQDSCDLVTGECVNEALDCDDDNVCTADTCDVESGDCTHTDVVCDDDNVCTTDVCDVESGECTHTDDVCDDGNLCTTDVCDEESGDCTHTDVICDDGIPCTADACDVSAGGCVYAAQDDDCDDGDICTTDVCDVDQGGCTNPAIICDDGIACTADTCDASAGGCVYAAQDTDCDDENLCTTDVCDVDQGGCTNPAVICDDGIPCTSQLCEPASGCLFSPQSESCDDGLPCTIDACLPELSNDPSGCTYTEKDCLTDDACVVSFCTPETGECATEDVVCDDGYSCTVDSCHPEQGCKHDPDPIACTSDSPCLVGMCMAEDYVLSEDNTTGCSQVAIPNLNGLVCHAAPCDMGICDNGVCVGNAVGDACDDNNACTTDSCAGDFPSDCVHIDIDCDDENPCTIDSCDSVAGCVYTFSTFAACDDGDPCTEYDNCGMDGVCTGEAASALPCDDGDACTLFDVCESGECVAGLEGCGAIQVGIDLNSADTPMVAPGEDAEFLILQADMTDMNMEVQPVTEALVRVVASEHSLYLDSPDNATANLGEGAQESLGPVVIPGHDGENLVAYWPKGGGNCSGVGNSGCVLEFNELSAMLLDDSGQQTATLPSESGLDRRQISGAVNTARNCGISATLTSRQVVGTAMGDSTFMLCFRSEYTHTYDTTCSWCDSGDGCDFITHFQSTLPELATSSPFEEVAYDAHDSTRCATLSKNGAELVVTSNESVLDATQSAAGIFDVAFRPSTQTSYIAWVEHEDIATQLFARIKVATFDADGVNASVTVIEDLPTDFSSPAIANLQLEVLNSGHLLVGWTEQGDGGRSARGRLVDLLPGGGLSTDGLSESVTSFAIKVPGDKRLGGLAPTADGGFIATWTDDTADGVNNSGVKARVFGPATGNEFGSSQGEISVNDRTDASQHTPSLTVLEDGSWVVSFAETSLGGEVSGWARRFSATGEPIPGAPDVSPGSSYDGHDYDIHAAVHQTTGQVLVVWLSDYGDSGPIYEVKARRFNLLGVPLGPVFSPLPEGTNALFPAPAIAATQNGWAIAWNEGLVDPQTEVRVYTRTIDLDETLGEPFLLAEGLSPDADDNDPIHPMIASNGETYLVTWCAFNGLGSIRGKLFSAIDGSTSDGTMGVYDFVLSDPEPSIYRVANLLTADVATGDYVIAWEDYDASNPGKTYLRRLRFSGDIDNPQTAFSDITKVETYDEFASEWPVGLVARQGTYTVCVASNVAYLSSTHSVLCQQYLDSADSGLVYQKNLDELSQLTYATSEGHHLAMHKPSGDLIYAGIFGQQLDFVENQYQRTEIQIQRFSASGTPKGRVVVANRYVGGFHSYPFIVPSIGPKPEVLALWATDEGYTLSNPPPVPFTKADNFLRHITLP